MKLGNDPVTKTEPKWVYNVVDRMLPHVPAREKGLIADLNKARETSVFQPPETQSSAWRKLQWAFLARWKNNPRSGWGKKLHEIYTEEFYKHFPDHPECGCHK